MPMLNVAPTLKIAWTDFKMVLSQFDGPMKICQIANLSHCQIKHVYSSIRNCTDGS